MKRVIWLLLLVLLLTGCLEPVETMEPVSCVAGAELTRLGKELAKTDMEMLELQENLARWYNVNLLVEHDKEYREKYSEILFYSDGVMGSLEIPSMQVHLPVYHGNSGDRGVGHDPDTAFPIGGIGNHPVLSVEEEIACMEVGEQFLIHILGETLTYQVVAVREDWDTTPVPDMDYCSLILNEEYQILGVRTE